MYRRGLKIVGVLGGTTAASSIAIGAYSSYRINSKRQRCYTDNFHPTPETLRMPLGRVRVSNQGRYSALSVVHTSNKKRKVK